MQLSSLIGHVQELLGIILNSQKPADAIMDTYFRSHKYLGSHDRKFIAETTYGTLRHLRKCEVITASALADVNENVFEEDRILLLVVAYGLLKGTIKGLTPELISSKFKSTSLAERCENIFQKLSTPVQTPSASAAEHIGMEHSFPDWMVEKFIDQYGDNETEKICASLNEPAPLTLRVNMLKATVEQCRTELGSLGIETAPTNLSPFGLSLAKRINVFSLPIFRNGWFEVQDEGSQLLPVLIDPKPNSKLLDVCAGAGGKTLEFAALMNNRGEIFAADINQYRLEELRKRLKRAGAQNVRVLEISSIEDLAEKYTSFFDIVFADAPCSGLGTIRRNPGMKWKVTEKTIEEVSEKQRTILHHSAPLVKEGGRLVYATCTLLKEENENIVEEFISKHSEFSLADINAKGGLERLGLISGGSYLRLLPHTHGTDGFFCAVMEKQSNR